MVNNIKKHIADFLLGILTIVVVAVTTVLWNLNCAQAAQFERVNGLEKQITVMREENKRDHDKILDVLLNRN